MEVLFKALRVDTKEWVEGDLIRTETNGVHISFTPFNFMVNWEQRLIGTTTVEVNPETVCMFWKEHKKAGKVFSGDKVKVQGTKRVGIYETEIIFDGTMFRLKENKTRFIDSSVFVAILENIGNIHNNESESN